MTDFFNAISNFGFPIVLAGYLLLRFESKIESLGKTVTRFSDLMEGKPSENKVGLIGVMQRNNTETKNLATKLEKLSKTIKT